MRSDEKVKKDRDVVATLKCKACRGRGFTTTVKTIITGSGERKEAVRWECDPCGATGTIKLRRVV